MRARRCVHSSSTVYSVHSSGCVYTVTDHFINPSSKQRESHSYACNVCTLLTAAAAAARRVKIYGRRHVCGASRGGVGAEGHRIFTQSRVFRCHSKTCARRYTTLTPHPSIHGRAAWRQSRSAWHGSRSNHVFFFFSTDEFPSRRAIILRRQSV